MDPYSVLGVRRDATTEEINSAFKSLADKYSEDKYNGGPLAELAAKKRKEIEDAYDEIIKLRASQKAESEKKSSNASQSSSYTYTHSNPQYSEIRTLINAGDIMTASKLLDAVQTRDAEWFYLHGLVSLRKGMYNEAFESFKTAVNRDPSNEEYRAAYIRMQQQATGYRNVGGADADAAQCCNCCSNLMIADCCCECMGGDLVPCC